LIAFKVIADDQRLAVLRPGRTCRLVGPGIVLVVKRHGTRHWPISIGDGGQLVTPDQARFGDAVLPVERQGTKPSGAVRVIGFHGHRVVVGEAEASAGNFGPASPPKAAPPRYTPLGFWIGLPLVLLLAAVCWKGFLYAADQIHTERVVYARGVLITGTVVKKIRYHQTSPGEQTHYIVYAFRAPQGIPVRKEIRIDPAAWNRLRDNGPISVRYVPGQPELNLPDGWRMSELFYWAGGIALLGALFFSIVIIGMLIKKATGGYRGETHPFFGQKPPRRGS
jgi:hypothetical protein